MKTIIKLTAVLLLATLFFAGCDIGNDDSATNQTVAVGTGTGSHQGGADLEDELGGTSKTLESIEVTTKPKVEYFIGENLDIDGIVVTATYSDNSKGTVDINESNISGFDSSEPKTITLTVTYNDKTANFEVTVDNVSLKSIKITAEPVKTEYLLYEALDLDGIEVVAVLSDGTTEILDLGELETEDFDNTTLGEKTITVIIAGKTTTFTITIIPQTFTVTFNSDGVTFDTKTVTQPATTVDSLPETPTKTGYNFTVWDDGHGNSFTASSLVTGNIAVNAQWEKQTYTVTFNSNGGSAVASQDVNYNTTAVKPADPVKNAYDLKFEGWYKDNTTFNEPWNFSTPVNVSITLYAKWGTYKLGDNGPGGGKIFFGNETGFNMKGIGTCYYLEASPNDLSPVQWGGNSDDFSTTGTAIGDGKQNTQILFAKINGDGEKERAVQLCVSYINNGLNDWFLPSKSELYTLFVNRVAAGITLQTSSSSYYWSSSAGNSNQQAWAYLLSSSGTITDTSRNRTNTSIVRAIRAF